LKDEDNAGTKKEKSDKRKRKPKFVKINNDKQEQGYEISMTSILSDTAKYSEGSRFCIYM
jgi:hypothetical protein